MAHTYEELHKTTVAHLREIAKGLDDPKLSGYSTMHKEDLVIALCHVLGIEDHKRHEVVGVDKASIKAQIRQLKLNRDAAIEAKDYADLKLIRRKIKRLKHKVRKATI
jgi:protein-arginine kinase activator protein McsA